MDLMLTIAMLRGQRRFPSYSPLIAGPPANLLESLTIQGMTSNSDQNSCSRLSLLAVAFESGANQAIQRGR